MVHGHRHMDDDSGAKKANEAKRSIIKRILPTQSNHASITTKT